MIKAAIALFCLLPATALAGGVGRPVLVELFTSEGCSSCPPADALLAELARRSDLLALSFHVDYWDRLGWKDRFASVAATRRQVRYARLLGLGTVYTPQIVLDGRWQAVGSDRRAVAQALASARQKAETVPLTVTIEHGVARSAFGGDPTGHNAAVLLVAFDSRRIDRIGGGENEGRTLTHIDVVRGFAAVGRADGVAGVVMAPVPWPADRVAAILQEDDGRVVGVAVTDGSSGRLKSAVPFGARL